MTRVSTDRRLAAGYGRRIRSRRLWHRAPRAFRVRVWQTTLVQAAWAAARKHDSYLRAQFLRLKSRRGPKKAIIAVAASMLTAAYYMLRDGVDYRDLGAAHFDRRDKATLAKRLLARLHDLGFNVELRAA